MSIKLKNIFQMQYKTPYELKRELELIMWCRIDDDLWSKIQPQTELPWHESDLHKALLQLYDELELSHN